jgi:hypothetical protein
MQSMQLLGIDVIVLCVVTPTVRRIILPPSSGRILIPLVKSSNLATVS